MDKENMVKLVTAVTLSFIVLVGSQIFFSKKYPAPATPTPVVQGTPPTADTNAPSLPALTVEPVYSPKVNGTPVFISTEHFDAAFNADTGDVTMVSLKSYNVGDTPPTFKRDNGDYATFTAGIANGFSYEVNRTSDGTILTFTAENEQIQVVKRYTLGDSYHIPMELSVTNLTSTALAIPLKSTVGPGFGSGFDLNKYVFEGPILHNAAGTEKKRDDKVKSPIVLDKPLWAGYTSKYFLFSIFSEGFERAEITKDGNSAVVSLTGTLNVPAVSNAGVESLALYVGPKIYNDLNAYGNGLQKSIDYGVFFFLGIPMTKVMNFSYGFVHNYGIAIIILTIIVRLCTLPLTIKSAISMKAMSKLQPEMLALREKHKEEPQKLNAATMELYRKHKVNPLAGCLPLIIQLPIFFALYKSLLVSIELKGAPFFGWIVDLSVKDPYYITPVLMGVTMFLQQKLTPSAMDPAQQRIFLIMPVVFTFLFLNFQSGLVVYWLTNNILSIIQQLVINKYKS